MSSSPSPSLPLSCPGHRATGTSPAAVAPSPPWAYARAATPGRCRYCPATRSYFPRSHDRLSVTPRSRAHAPKIAGAAGPPMCPALFCARTWPRLEAPYPGKSLAPTSAASVSGAHTPPPDPQSPQVWPCPPNFGRRRRPLCGALLGFPQGLGETRIEISIGVCCKLYDS